MLQNLGCNIIENILGLFAKVEYHNRWVLTNSHDREVPEDAIIGGKDIDGSKIYVGRSCHENDLIPGKAIPSRGRFYVAYGGKEHRKRNFELLVGFDDEFEWIPANSNGIPENAFECGYQNDGTKLYVGRAHFKGSKIVGKVHGESLFAPFAGLEHKLNEFEVLCLKNEKKAEHKGFSISASPTINFNLIKG